MYFWFSTLWHRKFTSADMAGDNGTCLIEHDLFIFTIFATNLDEFTIWFFHVIILIQLKISLIVVLVAGYFSYKLHRWVLKGSFDWFFLFPQVSDGENHDTRASLVWIVVDLVSSHLLFSFWSGVLHVRYVFCSICSMFWFSVAFS